MLGARLRKAHGPAPWKRFEGDLEKSMKGLEKHT